MGAIILILLLCTIGALLENFSNGNKFKETIGVILTVIGFICGLLIISCIIINIYSHKNIEIKYNQLIECINTEDESIKCRYANDVYDMNTEINKHKSHRGDWFIGILYSEDIAKLPNIKL